MKVKLTYNSTRISSDEIAEEIRDLQFRGKLPGLTPGAKDFFILVDIPEVLYIRLIGVIL